MRRISLALLIALLLPALAAGASKDTKLTLVAYSTPKDAYGQLITAFQKTEGGQRRHRSPSPTVPRGAEPGRRRRARRRHRRVLARAGHHVARPEEARRDELEQGQVPRHGDALGRGVHRPRRQPEEAEDLERPAQARRAGDHAEPVHVGWRSLERHGRLRWRAALRQVAEAGRRLPGQDVEARRRATDERARRPADLPCRAVAMSSSRTRTRRCSRRRRASPFSS